MICIESLFTKCLPFSDLQVDKNETNSRATPDNIPKASQISPESFEKTPEIEENAKNDVKESNNSSPINLNISSKDDEKIGEMDENQKNISLRDESSLLKQAIIKNKFENGDGSLKKRYPVFVMCTLTRGSNPSQAEISGMDEGKFSATTLADVLVDVPGSIPFIDISSFVLNQLHLVKEDTYCSKGN